MARAVAGRRRPERVWQSGLRTPNRNNDAARALICVNIISDRMLIEISLPA